MGAGLGFVVMARESMPDGSPPLPPSEPRPERPGLRDVIGYDRPARLQMIVALVLGLVLVAIPLYLWRRPRVESRVLVSDADGGLAAHVSADAETATEDAGGPVALGEARVLECHDPGPGATAPEKCDHLLEFERAFAKAIQDAAGCTASPGTAPYVADVSFARKKQPIHLTMGKERTLKAKAVVPCVAAVKKNLVAVPLDTIKHEHARYKIGIVATYPAR
jgi:hypothetical protein